MKERDGEGGGGVDQKKKRRGGNRKKLQQQVASRHQKRRWEGEGWVFEDSPKLALCLVSLGRGSTKS